MNHRIVIASLLAFLSVTTSAAPSAQQQLAPAGGWVVSSAQPKAYEIGEDASATARGTPSFYIRSTANHANGFGTLMQTISANNYRGKRVRFQAMLKSRDVSNWAGLWMRVDTATTPAIAFYNSQDNPIKGSSDWQLRSVTLDVPADATTLNFGVIDAGSGQVWIDQPTLEAVGDEVPVNRQPGLPTTPAL